MPTRYDVVVIGAGVAGSAAALAARNAGARVCVIARAPGASALFSGAWRGACPEPLRNALRAVGYDLEPVEHPLPHPNGFLTIADYATSSQRAAQLSSAATVCGIHGLPGFHAPSLAAQWSQQSGIPLIAQTITLPDTPPAGWAVASLSAHIQRNPGVLQDALAALGAERVIIPAVLDETQLKSDVTIGEALGAPPSLPGWRLQRALERALVAADIELLRGDVKADALSPGRVLQVAMHASPPVVLQAKAFVLATGKFVSGGIEANAAFREPVFDCPIWIDHLGDSFDTPDPLILTDPVRTEQQPLLSAGVHVDSEQRPVNRASDVVHANVFVAGSIRAGWAGATHGAGAAAEDGWNAGLKAVSA